MSAPQMPPVVSSQTPIPPPTLPPALTDSLQLKTYKHADFLASPTLTATLTQFLIDGYRTEDSPFPGPRFKTPTEIHEFLGPSGIYAVVYSGIEPVACTSTRPWAGDYDGYFPDDEKEGAWEINTVTTKKGWYKLGLVGRCIAVLREEVCQVEAEKGGEKGDGGFRFWLHCIESMNGDYWRRRGFRVVRSLERPDGCFGAKGYFMMQVMVEDAVTERM